MFRDDYVLMISKFIPYSTVTMPLKRKELTGIQFICTHKHKLTQRIERQIGNDL